MTGTKQPEQRPKRPLSAFNLFYRFKRAKILEAHANGDDSKETIHRVVAAVPGLEDYSPIALSSMSPERKMEICKTEIHSALEENLSPNDTRERIHRKSHGCMTFVEMSRIMSVSWKSIDEYAKSVFEKLAIEGRKMYTKRVEEYEKNNPSATKNDKPTDSTIESDKVADAPEKNPMSELDDKTVKDDGPDTITLKTSRKAKADNGKARSQRRRSANGNEQRPKRPLSAYNLFYRFKRAKILKAHNDGDESKETIVRLINAIPGLEDYPSVACTLSSEHVRELCRAEIRSALEQNLAPNETRERVHRKSHGCMTFIEMSKIMCDSWKAIDGYTKTVFEELAEEGRKIYHQRVAEYDKKNALSPSKKNKTSATFSAVPEHSELKSAQCEIHTNETTSQCEASAVDIPMGTPMKTLERRASAPARVSPASPMNVPTDVPPRITPTSLSSVSFCMEPLPLFPNIFERQRHLPNSVSLDSMARPYDARSSYGHVEHMQPLPHWNNEGTHSPDTEAFQDELMKLMPHESSHGPDHESLDDFLEDIISE